MDKIWLLQHLKNNIYCRLQPSNIHIGGVGVFAVRTIPKDTDPFQGCPNLQHIYIDKKEVATLPKPTQKLIRDMCVLRKGRYLVPNLSQIDISYFINHSDNPNIGTYSGGEFFALRKIKAGEELSVDYNTYSEK